MLDVAMLSVMVAQLALLYTTNAKI